jgi:hypothetical protein
MDDVIENAPPSLHQRPPVRPRTLVITAAVVAVAAAGWFGRHQLTASEPATAPAPIRTTERPAPTPTERVAAGLFQKAVDSIEHRPGFVTATSVEVTPAQAGNPMMTRDETVPPGHYLVDLLCLGRGSVLVSVGDPVSIDSFAAPSIRLECGAGPTGKATLELSTNGPFALGYAADDGTLGAFAWAVSRI